MMTTTMMMIMSHFMQKKNVDSQTRLNDSRKVVT